MLKNTQKAFLDNEAQRSFPPEKLFYFILNLCVPVYVYVHRHVGDCAGQKRASDPWKLGL